MEPKINQFVYQAALEVLTDKCLLIKNEFEGDISSICCNVAGIYPFIKFILSIEGILCSLKIRTVKLNRNDYIINAVLNGIDRVGKPEVRVMNLNTDAMFNQPNSKKNIEGFSSEVYRRESVIRHLKHGLILPLLNMPSLILTSMPAQVLENIFSFCGVG